MRKLDISVCNQGNEVGAGIGDINISRNIEKNYALGTFNSKRLGRGKSSIDDW